MFKKMSKMEKLQRLKLKIQKFSHLISMSLAGFMDSLRTATPRSTLIFFVQLRLMITSLITPDFISGQEISKTQNMGFINIERLFKGRSEMIQLLSSLRLLNLTSSNLVQFSENQDMLMFIGILHWLTQVKKDTLI